MATIFIDSGGSARKDAGSGSFWTNAGTVTADATSPIRNPTSYKLATGSPAVTATMLRNSILADAGRRISFRMKFDTTPSAASSFLKIQTSGAGTTIMQLVLGTGKTLSTIAGGVTSGTSLVLSANQAYRITFSYFITNTTTWSLKVYIDGKQQISRSNDATLGSATSAQLTFENTSTWATNSNVWFDDIYIDDSAALTDTGNIIVTHKRPVANGTLNEWTTQVGSGGSGYGTGHSPQVNEQPVSGTNAWSIASASLKTEEYTIEGASVGDTDVSNARKYALIDYIGWASAKVATNGNRNMIVNGVTALKALITTNTTVFQIAGSTTYPSGATAIGFNNNSVNNLTTLNECGIVLAYKLNRKISIS